MMFLALCQLLITLPIGCEAGWKDQHPQQRYRIHSNVHDPATPDDAALRLPCYSCMSPYLEEHYPYIEHLYRKPLSFDSHCDRHSLDRTYLFVKNCSDMCVTLRINDVVGGRRRHGYVRGCLSDIHGYNHSLIRALRDNSNCIDTTAREFFSAQRQELEPSRLAICGCHSNLCNFTPNWLQFPSPVGIFTVFVSLLLATVI